MESYIMFLSGCVITCFITLLVNGVLKKRPRKADTLIDYIMISLLVILVSYAISITTWEPVEQKLSKELKEYRDTQKNVWRRK